MKKFILKIFLFLIPAVIVSYAGDWFLSSSLKKSKLGEYSVWNDLLSGRIQAETLIYGSSRAWVHIDPKIIDEELNTTTYNLGIDGHNFKLQALRHQLYLGIYPKPKRIIYAVDVFTLAQRKDLFNSEQFLPYLRDNNLIQKTTKDYEGFSYFDYHLPLVRYYGKTNTIKHAVNIAFNPEDNLIDRTRGFKGQKRTWNDDFRSAKEKFNTIKVEQDTVAIEKFKVFIQECKDHNIELVLVYPPEHIEGQKFVENRAEILERFSEISSEFRIPFFDYSKNYLSLDTAYFYNSSHLNFQGSAIFSLDLAGLLD